MRFRCERFPTGVAHIRTAGGTVVDFVDGSAEVDDPELAAALLAVPAVFGIVQVDAEPDPPHDPPSDSGEPALTSHPNELPAGMSVGATLDWVGENATRARVALDAETAEGGKNRATLVAKLTALVGDE